MNGSEALIRQLEANGVEHVFGVCGDTGIGLYRAFHDLDHGIHHVLARDERGASYMADAYARLSNRPGICEGPSGGGATYLIPGLAEANGSSIPVIGLNTSISTRYRGRGVLTELDQTDLFRSVTKWNATVDHPDLVPRMLRLAFRQATVDRPGATHLSLPMDVLHADTDATVHPDGDVSTYPAYRPDPDPARVQRAADLIDASDRPVIVVGGGVHSSGAWTDVRTFAERTGIPVAQTLTGCGAIGDSPYSIGVVGENGYREYANEIVSEADTVLLLGTAVESVWTFKWSQPREGEATIVHVDVDAGRIGLNYRTDCAIPGDLRNTVRALVDAVSADGKWDPNELAARKRSWRRTYEPHFDSNAFPIRPERMVADAQTVLDDDAIIVSDPGTSCPYFAALYDFPAAGRHWVTPRAHGALGYTIPGVLGAHFAKPDAPIVGYTGDGSFATATGDLETIARSEAPITIVVVNNDAFSWIEAGQRSYADFSFGVDFRGIDYADVAEGFGITGFRVESADDYASVLAEAVALDGPAVIDLPTQPLPSLEDAPVDWLEPDE